MMWFARSVVLVLALLLLAPNVMAADKYDPEMIDCDLTYNMKGWSFIYKRSRGEGTITCSNGQRADVELSLDSGGFTVGKSEIIGGTGNFTRSRDIADLYGSYAVAAAHGGMGESAEAGVMTKGEISLTLTGTGTGVDVGVSLGHLKISPK
jgi:hypothetical protein